MFKQENETNGFINICMILKDWKDVKNNFKKDTIKPTIDFSQRKYI